MFAFLIVKNMKYDISINQLVLAETTLDLIDCAILNYLIDFCSSDNKKIKQMSLEEGGLVYRYTWVNFGYLLKEMPLLRLKQKSSISKRICRIEDEGFIKTFLGPKRNLYIRLTERVSSLYFSYKNKEDVYKSRRTDPQTDPFVKINTPVRLDLQDHNTRDHKDIYTYTSNKMFDAPLSNNQAEKPTIKEEIEEIISFYSDRIKKTKTTPFLQQKLQQHLKNFSKDQLLSIVSRKSEERWFIENCAWRGAIWFFNNKSRLARYLDEI